MQYKIVTKVVSAAEDPENKWLDEYTVDRGWKIKQITSNCTGSGRTCLHVLMVQ